MINKIRYIYFFLCSALLLSCEDYLDKAPESDLNKQDVFQDFEHAQGFLEQCYGYVVNYAANIEWDVAGFLLGDESLPGNQQYKMDWYWELGTLQNYNNGKSFLYRNTTDITNDQSKNRPGIWQGWQAIRIANIVIEEINNPNLEANMSEDERKLLLGQAYFFRAFFHSEIMKFWGRIPYIDRVLTGNNNDFQIPRPSTYKECAMKADEDYARAAELLPEDWKLLEGKIEAITIHPTTYANSRRLINKAIVYSFKGRNLLYAASPLMYCSDNKLGIDSYLYDEELAIKAAEDLAKVIDMDKRDILGLGLADKEHLKYCFTTKANQKSLFPGTPEAIGASGQCEYIFSSTAEIPWAAQQLMGRSYMPYGATNQITPNHHFIHATFGTANGLSCDEDPTHDFQQEFENRDPRFYFNLIIDGEQIIQKPAAAPKYKYAQCYTNGLLRQSSVSKYPTGYFIKKWSLITRNSPLHGNTIVDNQHGLEWWMNMRLTDVYMMYAEALAATKEFGAIGKPNFNGITLSALDVLNIFRDRFEMPHVEESYKLINVDITSDSRRFMDVVRRERAIEMCFEACRWTDIRRWMIAHTLDCKFKSSLEFERDVYDDAHAKRGQFKNINFKEKEIMTRTCDYPKHYWLPFNQNEVNMYEGFPQNPGW